MQNAVDEFVIQRFLVTLLIYQWWKGTPISTVADIFDVDRRFIQGLPEKVNVILQQERGFQKLYGNFAIDPNAMLILKNRIYEIAVTM